MDASASKVVAVSWGTVSNINTDYKNTGLTNTSGEKNAYSLTEAGVHWIRSLSKVRSPLLQKWLLRWIPCSQILLAPKTVRRELHIKVFVYGWASLLKPSCFHIFVHPPVLFDANNIKIWSVLDTFIFNYDNRPSLIDLNLVDVRFVQNCSASDSSSCMRDKFSNVYQFNMVLAVLMRYHVLR